MERKIITEEKKNILMKMGNGFMANMTDESTVYIYDTPVFSDFCKLVEVDYDTLCRLKEVYSGEIIYSCESGKYIATCLTKKEGCIMDSLSMELECDHEFLGLFDKKENDDFFDDSVENIFLKLKEEHADVYEYIENEIISNIRDYDLEESAKEDIANEWIEDNPNIAVNVAQDYLCDDEKKDFIKDWVDNF